jgi:chemotaxis protein CheZ
MPAPEVASRIRSALDNIKNANLKDPHLGEVLSLAEQLTEAMKLFFSSLDNNVTSEFRYIADYIKRTRDEIAALRPNDIRESRLPSAGAELDAVVKDTEAATETIMQAAESVMELSPAEDLDAYKSAVDAQMMAIIEACSFQDITGQRVSKVVGTLEHIEGRISRFASVMGVKDAVQEKNDKERWRETNLLHGPQIGGPATKQESIDALFAADGAASLGQDDIDSLFD